MCTFAAGNNHGPCRSPVEQDCKVHLICEAHLVGNVQGVDRLPCWASLLCDKNLHAHITSVINPFLCSKCPSSS